MWLSAYMRFVPFGRLTQYCFRILTSTPRQSTPPLNGNAISTAPHKPVEPQSDLELALPPSPPPIEDIIAARRAKRAAILAKYQVAESGTSSRTVSEPTASAPAKPEGNGTTDPAQLAAPTSGSPPAPQQVEELSDGERCMTYEMCLVGHLIFRSPLLGQVTPPEREQAIFDLSKEGEEKAAPIAVTSSLSNVVSASVTVEPQDQVSAADYDPSMDRREDDARQARHAVAAFADGTGEILNQPEVTMESGDTGEAEDGVEEDDDEVDDMFAIDVDKPKKKKVAKVSCAI